MKDYFKKRAYGSMLKINTPVFRLAEKIFKSFS